jgi:isoquinoline 1-oxidoreductase subunit beta
VSAATKVEATYQVPFLAHATMEPMNCTVHVRKDSCEVWVGNQVLARAQAAAAKATGLPLDKVVVHNHLIGGGFGRRLEIDGVTRAVEIAKHVDGPVKVVWTREEDIQHDMYRPYFFDRISAGLDRKGKPIAWSHRFAGSSIIARWAPPLFSNGLDPDTTEGAIDLVYALPNMHVEYLRVEPPGIPTAFWRSVGPSHNVFVTESFMDELAAAAKQDPVAYRRALLDKAPRAKAVLELAAEKAGWGQPLPKGIGRGVAVQFVFATYMAQIAEVEVSGNGAVRIRRVVCAVDCGTVVNPDTVRAQIQSAIIFGITAALYGEITLKDGRVEQTNFDTYQILRINEAPAIEVHIVQNFEPASACESCRSTSRNSSRLKADSEVPPPAPSRFTPFGCLAWRSPCQILGRCRLPFCCQRSPCPPKPEAMLNMGRHCLAVALRATPRRPRTRSAPRWRACLGVSPERYQTFTTRKRWSVTPSVGTTRRSTAT